MTRPRIEWVTDLPPQDYRGGYAGKYEWFFNSLRERPGVWAQFPRQITSSNIRSSVAAQIRNGRYLGTSPGEFEAQSIDGVLITRYQTGASDE